MCGIVGILGREPVAAQLVDALKRLEYRGYDSAGVATLEDGQLDAPARRRQAAQPRKRGSQREPLAGTIGIGHTRWATHGKPTESNAHPHATDRLAVVHNGIIENFRELRDELEKTGRQVRHRDRHRSRRPSRHRRDEEGPLAGRGGGGGAAAAARRVRARLPVRRRGGSPDRRAQGLAARDRLRRRRDVSRLRRHRARAVHRHDHLSRGRRLGRAHAQRASRSTTPRAARSSARWSSRPPSALLVDKGNHRHFMAKEIHEQPEVVGHTLAHYLDMAAERVRLPASCRSISARSSACRSRPAARPITPAWSPNTGSSALRACRSRSTSPPNSATARRRCAPGGLAIFVSQSGETADTLATLRYAKEQKQHVLSVVNVPTSTIARESDVVMPTLAGPEIGVASTKAFTCQLAVLACLAIAAGRARGVLSDGGRAQAGARADRGAAPDERGAGARAADRAAGARSREDAATCSISAAAPAIRSRSKAR